MFEVAAWLAFLSLANSCRACSVKESVREIAKMAFMGERRFGDAIRFLSDIGLLSVISGKRARRHSIYHLHKAGRRSDAVSRLLGADSARRADVDSAPRADEEETIAGKTTKPTSRPPPSSEVSEAVKLHLHKWRAPFQEKKLPATASWAEPCKDAERHFDEEAAHRSAKEMLCFVCCGRFSARLTTTLDGLLGELSDDVLLHEARHVYALGCGQRPAWGRDQLAALLTNRLRDRLRDQGGEPDPRSTAGG